MTLNELKTKYEQYLNGKIAEYEKELIDEIDDFSADDIRIQNEQILTWKKMIEISKTFNEIPNNDEKSALLIISSFCATRLK